MVSVISAVFVLITAAFLTPLFTQLPEPVLGAIVVVAVRGFLRWRTMQDYWRRDRRTFAIAFTALLGVLVFDLLPGLIIAVALSLVLFVAYASAPRLSVLGRSAGGDYVDTAGRSDVSTVPDVLIVRPDGGLFFGNATRVRHGVTDLVVAQQPPPRVTCLVLTASYRLSVTVLDVLGELDDELARHGSELWLVGVPSAARAELDADPLATRLADGRVWPSVAAAIARADGGTGPRPSAGA